MKPHVIATFAAGTKLSMSSKATSAPDARGIARLKASNGNALADLGAIAAWAAAEWRAATARTLVRLHGEADLERHLIVRDLAVFHMATRLHDLEPSQMSNRLVGAADRSADGILDAGLGRAHEFDDFVDMVLLGGLLASLTKHLRRHRVPADHFRRNLSCSRVVQPLPASPRSVFLPPSMLRAFQAGASLSSCPTLPADQSIP